MIKKLVTSAIAGTCLMVMANSASAAQYNVNIYGASAQYTYWTTAAPAFLRAKGCDAADIRSAAKKVSGREQGIAWCAGSVGVGGVTGKGIKTGTTYDYNDYFIRYSANASYDGIMAVQNNGTYMPDADRTAGCANGERLMANENSVTWVAYPGNPTTGAIASVSCKDVVVGASDVAASSFKQKSKGFLTGHKEFGVPGATQVVRDIKGITINTANYSYVRPLVVPFAFFAHNTVPYDNVSRLMVTSIFSGQVANWQDFSDSNPDLPVVACLRHAGSGTHSTLDKAVMRGDFPLVQEQITPDESFGMFPVIWFNSGSSDEMNCINENQGAIGYADADRANMANTKRLYWMGASAIKANITNGLYDFWSNQWLYYAKSESTPVKNLITALNSFAGNAANMPASLATYWAAESEMKVGKGSDGEYPSFQ
ncbi:MAG: substrate-binding domain-containing protein [Desulfobacteraceae bacterium]|jgi:hypothetical protein